MMELTYTDAYKQVRSQTYESLDSMLLAFSGCVTVPDYYPVISLTKDGETLDFKGSIGDLYGFLNRLQQEENN